MDKCTEPTRNRKATPVHVESLGRLDDLRVASRFEVDAVIYNCGERAGFWYQIASGTARKCIFTLDGGGQIVDFLTQGDLFGFDSRELHQFRVETIVSAARLARFPRRAAEQMANGDARLARLLRELAFESVSRIQRRMLILRRATALEKVSNFLLEIADRATTRDLFVTLPMCRKDIADYLAMAVETLCRARRRTDTDRDRADDGRRLFGSLIARCHLGAVCCGGIPVCRPGFDRTGCVVHRCTALRTEGDQDLRSARLPARPFGLTLGGCRADEIVRLNRSESGSIKPGKEPFGPIRGVTPGPHCLASLSFILGSDRDGRSPMLSAASSGVGVDSGRDESTYSAGIGRAARLNARVSGGLGRDRTLASAYPQSAELRAHKKGRFSERGGRVTPRIGPANLDGNAEEASPFRGGLTTPRQVEMQPRERQWRYRMTLSRANRIAALGEMSASIVHEINQPVAAVVTNAQAALRFLEGPKPDLEEVRQALTRIARLGNRVVEVVRHTRALVQRTPPRKADFEINEAIEEIIALSQAELLKNAVSVHTQFAPDLPLLRADRIQLQQVILNLITNAVEAMSGVCEARRELRITTAQTNPGEIQVTVQDSGPGLGARNPDRLFDAFYSTKPSGLGIGLSICRSIIEAHKGQLWASQRKVRGATFQFTLPVCIEDASPEWAPIGG
jgi:signal transduction histidine kinase/CRP-like cAMP-binding protein